MGHYLIFTPLSLGDGPARQKASGCRPRSHQGGWQALTHHERSVPSADADKYLQLNLGNLKGDGSIMEGVHRLVLTLIKG